MIGYHFTSWSNWLKIKKEGLVPYLCHEQDLAQYGIGKVIWMWPNMGDKRHVAGSVLYQVSTKAESKVVLLEAQFEVTDTLHWVSITHDGTVGKWTYHKGKPGLLVKNPIPAKQIKLLKVYDLEKLII
jgi:hypothetical protein